MVTTILVIINYLASQIKVPISLAATQENKETKEKNTNFINRQTNQCLRTIKLTILVKRRKGINFILKKYIEKHRIYILIKCNPPGLELQASNCQLDHEIISIEDNVGFYLDITNYLHSICRHNTDAEPSKSYNYFIKEIRETRTPINNDICCYINPELKIDEFEDAPWLLKFALRWSAEQHKVTFRF